LLRFLDSGKEAPEWFLRRPRTAERNLLSVTANSVVAGSTTNWTFGYDNSGNMISRSDGTNTTTYAWDEDNRLNLVTLPSSATVAYTWDVVGRMLTRTDSTGTTYFAWDAWAMVAELAPNGTQTR
jgi:YD repeat-containing protein